jgi:hypothetical protein
MAKATIRFSGTTPPQRQKMIRNLTRRRPRPRRRLFLRFEDDDEDEDDFRGSVGVYGQSRLV